MTSPPGKGGLLILSLSLVIEVQALSELVLDRAVLREMVERCLAARPLEACGILGGRGRVAVSHYPVSNISKEPARRFYMEPEEQLDAFRRMERLGEELVAIYHSHPATSPVPSARDIEEAFYPNAFYIIVGTAYQKPKVRVFRVNGQAKTAVEVRWRSRRIAR